MNYYEEFGIDRNATATEIREAYKLAARLLHPDNQREPRLKDMAECQMKRLSDVVAVLLNPRQRARYDEGLADEFRLGQLIPLAPPSGPQLPRTVLRPWFWALLGSISMMSMMTIGIGAWYGLARNTDAPPPSALAESATGPTATGAAHSERVPLMNPRVKPAEIPPKTTADAETPAGTKTTRGAYLPIRHRAGAAPLPLVSATAPTPVEAPTAAPEEEQRGLPPAQNAPAEVARSRGESRFAGEWLFAADAKVKDPAGTYPARYVEFQLREESGILVGDYRSLHRVSDKAISPEVAFRVRGESSPGNAGKLSWESSGGAKGELELTLRSPNQLQLKWWTTQFGRQEALSSGMAVLMRLKTP